MYSEVPNKRGGGGGVPFIFQFEDPPPPPPAPYLEIGDQIIPQRSSLEYLKSIDIENTSWAKSLFRRMDFVKRAATTGRPEIPEGTRKEAVILFHHQIVELVEEHNFPPSFILNFAQTPLNYAPVASQTLASKGSKHIVISGITYIKLLTATFGITLLNHFLPIQLIYGGKTSQSLPKIKFPQSFSLSVNEKHFSNTSESIKLVDEIIIPYIETERHRLDRENQSALLIIDVFREQVTQPVLDMLNNNNIFLVPLPPNMTHLYQPCRQPISQVILRT